MESRFFTTKNYKKRSYQTTEPVATKREKLTEIKETNLPNLKSCNKTTVSSPFALKSSIQWTDWGQT